MTHFYCLHVKPDVGFLYVERQNNCNQNSYEVFDCVTSFKLLFRKVQIYTKAHFLMNLPHLHFLLFEVQTVLSLLAHYELCLPFMSVMPNLFGL